MSAVPEFQASDPLEFDEAEHVYRVRGKIVPGVTSVLQLLDDWVRFVDAEVLAAASEFGTHVHQACHLDNIGQLDEASLDPHVGAYLEGWRKFCHDQEFVVLESERRLFHRSMWYAGTLDVIGQFSTGRNRGQLPSLVDIKTGSAMPRTVGMQTAAYAKAYGQRVNRYCVQLVPGDYSLKRFNDPNDFEMFKAALTCYRWKHKL